MRPSVGAGAVQCVQHTTITHPPLLRSTHQPPLGRIGTVSHLEGVSAKDRVDRE
ncbi:MAG: hypothetical protein H6729_15740 [Deltaproteobacteria bacterium]|nr:hypothetical protein [Deltaproteobacteria bacterium]